MNGRNESSMLLRGSDLIKYRKGKQNKKSRPYKNSNLSDTEQLNALKHVHVDESYVSLTTPIVDKINNFTKGTVIGFTKLVLLDNSRITVLPHMGIKSNGGKCLLPEETLFMMHKGKLMVYYEESCLSVQAALSLLLHHENCLQRYVVYNHLAKFALKLRCNVSNEDNKDVNYPENTCSDIENNGNVTTCKRTLTDFSESINNMSKSRKRSKINQFEEQPKLNSTVEMMQFEKKINCCDNELDFDLRWDSSNYSNEIILQKFKIGYNKDNRNRFYSFAMLPSMIQTPVLTISIPDISVIGTDWASLAGREYIVDSNQCSGKEADWNKSSEISEQESSCRSRRQRKSSFKDHSYDFPMCLNKSSVTISRSWKEYKSINKYLLNEKIKNRLKPDILWKGKTKPLIRHYTARSDLSLGLESKVKDEAYIENPSFSCTPPCYDVYSRSCKYSQRASPLARVFIAKEDILPHRQLISAANEDTLSVVACCSISFRIISVFKYHASNNT